MDKLVEYLNPETAALIVRDINALSAKGNLPVELSNVRSVILDWYKVQSEQYKEVFLEVVK